MGHRIMGQVWTLAANNRFLAQEKTLQNDRILGGGDARIGLGFLMQDWRELPPIATYWRLGASGDSQTDDEDNHQD